MVNKGEVPNAWDDDDWETQADKAETVTSPPAEPTKLSKAERLARHAESNKKLWDSAESPTPPVHFLTTQSTIPLKTSFKPALKVLSRKPAPNITATKDPITGMLKEMKIEDDEDEEEVDRNTLSPEEKRAKAQRERDEKMKKYDEVRAKIFGTSGTSGLGGGAEGGISISGNSTPGTVTPPDNNNNRVGKSSRARGGLISLSNRGEEKIVPMENRRPGSSSSGQQRELFDPNYTAKPGGGLSGGGVSLHQYQRGNSPGRSTPREKEESQVLRQPRAPDSSGRGGFGFGGRGK